MADIRLANDADIAAITDIMRIAAEESIATFTIHPLGEAEWRAKWEHSRAFFPWLVAVEQGEVLGFAKAGQFRDNDAYVYTVEVSVYLRRAHQKKGLGKQLYDRLFGLLHLQGYHRVIAVVVSENEDSIAFHERMGMARSGSIARIGWKFDRFLGITYLDMGLQDDHQMPGRILTVAEVTA